MRGRPTRSVAEYRPRITLESKRTRDCWRSALANPAAREHKAADMANSFDPLSYTIESVHTASS
jgi:hypothetical protein